MSKHIFQILISINTINLSACLYLILLVMIRKRIVTSLFSISCHFFVFNLFGTGDTHWFEDLDMLINIMFYYYLYGSKKTFLQVLVILKGMLKNYEKIWKTSSLLITDNGLLSMCVEFVIKIFRLHRMNLKLSLIHSFTPYSIFQRNKGSTRQYFDTVSIFWHIPHVQK